MVRLILFMEEMRNWKLEIISMSERGQRKQWERTGKEQEKDRKGTNWRLQKPELGTGKQAAERRGFQSWRRTMGWRGTARTVDWTMGWRGLWNGQDYGYMENPGQGGCSTEAK